MRPKNTLMLGSIFVLFADIIGRLIVYPYEINIGLTIGVFGTWSPLYIEIILGTMRPKNGKVPTVTTTKAVNAAVKMHFHIR
jgi:ABC-type enterochelin transport system permease subunit